MNVENEILENEDLDTTHPQTLPKLENEASKLENEASMPKHEIQIFKFEKKSMPKQTGKRSFSNWKTKHQIWKNEAHIPNHEIEIFELENKVLELK